MTTHSPTDSLTDQNEYDTVRDFAGENVEGDDDDDIRTTVLDIINSEQNEYDTVRDFAGENVELYPWFLFCLSLC